jgi:hypothetical protein
MREKAQSDLDQARTNQAEDIKKLFTELFYPPVLDLAVFEKALGHINGLEEDILEAIEFLGSKDEVTGQQKLMLQRLGVDENIAELEAYFSGWIGEDEDHGKARRLANGIIHLFKDYQR